MRKFTSMIALLLTCTGAFAQLTQPSTILPADELTPSETKRVFLKGCSSNNSNWFTGEVSSQNISEKTLFELVKKDNGHVLKRVATGNYVTKNGENVGFSAEATAQKFEFIGNPDMSDPAFVSGGDYVRFKQAGGNLFLNVQRDDQTPKFLSGTGSWSVVRVYDASEYSLVTLNINIEGVTSQIKKVYKTNDNIEFPSYEGYKTFQAAVTKTNSDDQVVNVKYYRLPESAREVLNTKGKVGYPVNEQLYTTLEEKITAATADNEESLQALDDALQALYTDINVKLPEDGKTYVFTNHHLKNDGSIAKNYLKCTPERLDFVGLPVGTQAQGYAMEAKFTCHKLENGRYVFVNNEGKYMVFRGKGHNGTAGYNSNKGFVTEYNAEYCPMAVEKPATCVGKTLFGLLSFGGKRADNGNDSYIIINFNGSSITFEQTMGFSFLFDENNSSAFQIEEVSYPNNPTLNPILGDAVSITGAKSIATFSAPFATTIPAGISAFYARQIDTNTAQLEKITGNVIPANTGVILTSEEETAKALMVPAIEAATDNIQNNQLGHSAGADKVLTGNFFILGKSNNTVGFFKGVDNSTLPMNKSYLMSDAAAPAMKLIYGGENPGDGTTGIESMDAQDNASAAPIYDLSGRRVMKTVKGGLYIQNGKKLVIK